MLCRLWHLMHTTTLALLASLPAVACGLHFPWGDDGPPATCASRTGVSFDAATPGFDAGPDAAADSATRVWTGTLNYFDTQSSHLTTSFELSMNWSGEPVTVLNGPCIEGSEGQSSRPPYRIPILAQFATGDGWFAETLHGVVTEATDGSGDLTVDFDDLDFSQLKGSFQWTDLSGFTAAPESTRSWFNFMTLIFRKQSNKLELIYQPVLPHWLGLYFQPTGAGRVLSLEASPTF